MHCGVIRRGHQPGGATLGPISQAVLAKGNPNYLANLILFPGNNKPSQVRWYRYGTCPNQLHASICRYQCPAMSGNPSC